MHAFVESRRRIEGELIVLGSGGGRAVFVAGLRLR